MFNGYVLYLQAVTTPNPFVKLPKLPFHKSLLLIFCLRLRFPFSFFKLFFAAAALVIFPGWLRLFFRRGLFFRRLWLFPTAALVISHGGFGYFPGVALVIFPGWPVFPAALVISPGRLRLFSQGGSGYFPAAAWLFSWGGLFFRRLWLFSTAALVIFRGGLFFSGGLGYFPGVAPVIFPPR